MRRSTPLFVRAGMALLFGLAPAVAQEASPSPKATATATDRLRTEAERVLELVQTPGARSFLAATATLPTIAEREVYSDAKTRDALTPEEYARLPEDARARFKSSTLGEDFYYTTRYGSPLAYARVLELIGKLAGEPAQDSLSGKRILDFGYGGIGHLRLLASLGCDAVGVDVDPLLHAFYRAEDQGAIPSARAGGRAGKLTLVHGHWPGDEAVKRAVGDGFDLVLSKNVLKKGYVRPEKKVDPALLVDLGVAPDEFLRQVASALKPGGLFAIYNLCPAPRSDRYIPWAYGESPFTREELAAAGFELLAFDVDDRPAAMELGWALEWDQQGQDVEHDLFAWYTIARRKPG